MKKKTINKMHVKTRNARIKVIQTCTVFIGLWVTHHVTRYNRIIWA